MTIKQVIRNAQIITVQTTTGTSVRVTKKEARKYIQFCETTEREYEVDTEEIYAGRLLVMLKSRDDNV